MNATFAVFHADRRRAGDVPEPEAIRGGTLTKYKTVDGYRRMIAMLFVSIRRSNPGSTCVILSDAHTRGLDDLGADEVLRFDVDAQQLMLARMEAQLEYLRQHPAGDALVLLDSDMLVVESIAPVFAGTFAVGVTHREDEKEMPYNGGIFFLRSQRLPEAIQFFERMRAIYLRDYAEYAAWWGDQMALRDAVGESKERFGDGVVRVFPCSTFNYSPAYGRVYREVLREPRRASIWHFKGSRKLAMRAYFGTQLSPRPASRAAARIGLRVLCLLERLRRRRASDANE
jgi:hypothetical protein